MVNTMWITDKNAKIESNKLVVVALPLEDGLYDYQVATLEKGVDGDVEVDIFVLWDDVGTTLSMDEIEAYFQFSEIGGGK